MLVGLVQGVELISMYIHMTRSGTTLESPLVLQISQEIHPFIILYEEQILCRLLLLRSATSAVGQTDMGSLCTSTYLYT